MDMSVGRMVLMSKHEFDHIQSGGYFRKRVVLSQLRIAGLSIFPKVQRELEQKTLSEKQRYSDDHKLDFSRADSRFLA